MFFLSFLLTFLEVDVAQNVYQKEAAASNESPLT